MLYMIRYPRLVECSLNIIKHAIFQILHFLDLLFSFIIFLLFVLFLFLTFTVMSTLLAIFISTHDTP